MSAIGIIFVVCVCVEAFVSLPVASWVLVLPKITLWTFYNSQNCNYASFEVEQVRKIGKYTGRLLFM